jgi:predicted nucleic acid-binding protein
LSPKKQNFSRKNDTIKRYVFDSYAILSLLFKEASSAQVKKILRDAHMGEVEVLMHWNNIAEVYYIVRKQESQKKALETIALIKALPIQCIEFDEVLWLKAAEIKGTLPISFADAFVAATAQHMDGIIVTGDPEFEKLGEHVPIHWLSRKKK